MEGVQIPSSDSFSIGQVCTEGSEEWCWCLHPVQGSRGWKGLIFSSPAAPCQAPAPDLGSQAISRPPFGVMWDWDPPLLAISSFSLLLIPGFLSRIPFHPAPSRRAQGSFQLMSLWQHSEEVAVCKTGRESSGETNLLIPRSCTFSF